MTTTTPVSNNKMEMLEPDTDLFFTEETQQAAKDDWLEPNVDYKIKRLKSALKKDKIAFGEMNVGNPLTHCIFTRYCHQMAVGLSPAGFLSTHRHIHAYRTAINKHLYKWKYIPCENLSKYILAWLPRTHRMRELSSLHFEFDLTKCVDHKPLAELVINTYTDTEIFDQDFAEEWAALLGQFKYVLKHYTMKTRNKELPVGLTTANSVELFHGREYDTDTTYTARAWTTDESVAKFFAKRFVADGKPTRPVYRVTLTQEELQRRMLFYTDARNEKEVYLLDGYDVDADNTEAEEI